METIKTDPGGLHWSLLLEGGEIETHSHTTHSLTLWPVSIYTRCLRDALNHLSLSLQESFKFYADKLKERAEKSQTMAKE